MNSIEYFMSIFLGTFLLEDVALASAIALVGDDKIHLASAFLACFLGISFGDLGLYIIGLAMSRSGIENRFKWIKSLRARTINNKRSDLLTYSVILSRFVPGTRLPTYLTAGLLRYPFWRFFILTVATVFAWVAVAFAVGESLHPVMMNHWFLSILALLLLLKIVKSLVPLLSDRWELKARLHSWRKWAHFEFWPATLFYLPIIPYYAFLACKHRSLLMPFYANPEIKNGGLIGESKWDFLKHLNPAAPSTLKAIKISKQNDFITARANLEKEGFHYPFVIKPDVGQRGFGVRIIRDDFDLTEYLLLANFDMIVQELSPYSNEAGIFYFKFPQNGKSTLFSITDKKFPIVTGDGQTKLGDLILADRRARRIASTYFSRLQNRLNEVPKLGATISLAECGNHCQGAIFLNGADLKTEKLHNALALIANEIPHFYFGRFDVRYKDADSLKNGEHFHIVEVNGAGSEATHIWDPKTTLWEAYITLFKQWRTLFEIGAAVQRSQGVKSKVKKRIFLKECFKVFFRKDALGISS